MVALVIGLERIGLTQYNMTYCVCFVSRLGTATQKLVESGIPVIVAAGNDGTDACNSSPGRVKSVLTIGASCVGGDPEFCGGPADAVASWSCFGPCVDLYAPGDLIVSGKDSFSLFV